MPEGPADHNRTSWDERSAGYQERHGGQLAGDSWGVWQIPESELAILGDVAGLDVLELGCGAAQWSIALAVRGARMTALDTSQRQLDHAHELMALAGVDFTLVHADATDTGLPGDAFDIVFCDHGAMRFADPHATIPEAARLLRPGGLLAFSMYTPFIDLVYDDDAQAPTDRLLRDYFGMNALPGAPDDPVAFQVPYGTWIALLRESGLVVEDLIELRPAANAASSFLGEAEREWARRWPLEHVWRARLRGSSNGA